MAFNKNKYLSRLVDSRIKEYLSIFGAISIEGPKWCGKTWSGYHNANFILNFEDSNEKQKFLLSPENYFELKKPILIDEWTLVPECWDMIRHQCDVNDEKGQFILTCSTKLSDDIKKSVHHSGAGRIASIKLSTMSLYESNDSSGEVSLINMYNKTQKNILLEKPKIEHVAYLIERGGWPGNLETKKENCGIIPLEYIKSIVQYDISEDKNRNKTKMMMLLKSLARNESSIISNKTILRDIDEYENEEKQLENRNTIADYLDVLDRLYITENQPAYSSNFRSNLRIGKMPKIHFTDPSLAMALLSINYKELLDDIKTFGFLFEALVERDLRIYIESLNGKLYHFRDNTTGDEVDSIIEFSNGEYAAVEIKLGANQLEEAKKSLIKFKTKMVKQPIFSCIIMSNYDAVMYDKENNIYMFPITVLKP